MSLVTSSISYGATNAENPLAALLIQHREIKSGLGAMELVTKQGRSLADVTFKLMADPRNREFLNSKEGIELRKHQELLTNFLSVQDQFEKCVKDKEGAKKLDSRILEASFQNMQKLPDRSLPCLPESYLAHKSYEDFSNSIIVSMKSKINPYFQNQLTKKVMLNTAKSILAFRQKFHPDFMKDGNLSDQELNSLVNDVCVKKTYAARAVQTQDVCNLMDKSFRSSLSKEISSFAKSNTIKNKKISPEEATKSLNESVDKMNKALALIEIKKDKGWIYDSAKLDDPKIKKDFDTYINQYTTEISNPAGSLFLTKAIKEESGSIKRLDSDDTTKDKSNRYEFVKHKPIKLKDVNLAINEVEKKMKAQANDTLAIAALSVSKPGFIKSSEDGIDDLVKINPFAAGQLVLEEPEYTGRLCDAINRVNQDDIDDKNLDKYFTIGSAVLGGALILTGVGTVAGAYIITGSLSAGIAAGTMGGTILGYSALAGTAVELASLGYQANKAQNYWDEAQKLEASYLTRNGDIHNILIAQKALVDFKEARLSATISLAAVGLHALTVGKVFNLLKSTNSVVGPDEVRAATKIMHYLGKTKVAKSLQDTAVMLGKAGAEKIDDFLFLLARTGEVNRIKFLELLQSAKLTPDKIKIIVEDALEAAKACGKV